MGKPSTPAAGACRPRVSTPDEDCSEVAATRGLRAVAERSAGPACAGKPFVRISRSCHSWVDPCVHGEASAKAAPRASRCPSGAPLAFTLTRATPAHASQQAPLDTQGQYQSMIRGTDLAMLELAQKIQASVVVGDTVGAEVEVTGLSPTSRHDRVIVDSTITVFSQSGEKVMTYTAKRMRAGRSSA